ncbi:MAG: AraC family transcriptional regulator [Caldilineaceae bacterium]|nr:AraC family transcriptional regulator [Caldilineaceae bacterium]MCB0144085.1 AraC family transcriptional regulator [Caldilineaceae bacterium]MCB9157994.1 AraC family transcriptional regulator [Caldilineaceae bacterium]
MRSQQQPKRDADQMDAHRAELVERMTRVNRTDGRVEPLAGLFLNRLSTQQSVHGVSEPAFCVVAQGSKAVFVGDERHLYDPAHYLLFTTELPYASQVIEGSPESPYLSLRLNLDPALVSAVMVEAGHVAPRGEANVRATNVNPLDASLLDAMVRLVRLIDTPADAPVLAPLITREIVYRLLQGNQGDRLRYITAQRGHTHRIARAIQQFHEKFDQPLRIDDIAQDLGMSVSSFHQHFKAVTAMTPLQFQKQLQLQEARRLMLGEDLDATTAGSRVGYNDAAHFSREYKRLFGLPPMRDVERLRAAARTYSEPAMNHQVTTTASYRPIE